MNILSLCILSTPFLIPIDTDLIEESEQYYHQQEDAWPDLETFKKMPFDYTIHDPKYEDASLICSRIQTMSSEGQSSYLFKKRETYSPVIWLCCQNSQNVKCYHVLPNCCWQQVVKISSWGCTGWGRNGVFWGKN